MTWWMWMPLSTQWPGSCCGSSTVTQDCRGRSAPETAAAVLYEVCAALLGVPPVFELVQARSNTLIDAAAGTEIAAKPAVLTAAGTGHGTNSGCRSSSTPPEGPVRSVLLVAAQQKQQALQTLAVTLCQHMLQQQHSCQLLLLLPQLLSRWGSLASQPLVLFT